MKPYTVPAGGDPGLQPERTALARTRTALAIAVNALFSIRARYGVASVFVGGVA